MSILQVKNMPPELHAKLAAKAKAEATTMSALVVAMLERSLNEHPTTAWLREVQEMHARHPRSPSDPPIDVVRAVREAREEDDRHWDEYSEERARGAAC